MHGNANLLYLLQPVIQPSEGGKNIRKKRWTIEMGFTDKWKEESTYSVASGQDQAYVVLQVTLKEKFMGTGSGNLHELENLINAQAAKGYRLHTIATSESSSKGFGGGDRIQATLVFEHL